MRGGGGEGAPPRPGAALWCRCRASALFSAASAPFSTAKIQTLFISYTPNTQHVVTLTRTRRHIAVASGYTTKKTDKRYQMVVFSDLCINKSI